MEQINRIKRIKRSEATWRELFARQEASGVSVQAFCRNEGITPGVFRRWRSILSGKVQKATKRSAISKATTPFIDIGAMAADRSGFQVRLELGGGVTLNIGRG